MTRQNPYAELNNRDSALVQDALTRRCGICGAKPDKDCTNTMVTSSTMPSGVPLPDRLVHIARCSP